MSERGKLAWEGISWPGVCQDVIVRVLSYWAGVISFQIPKLLLHKDLIVLVSNWDGQKYIFVLPTESIEPWCYKTYTEMS